jgi:stage V sporulation protein SpoVS
MSEAHASGLWSCRVCVQGIGATSVGIAIRAIAIARQYIFDDRY